MRVIPICFVLPKYQKFTAPLQDWLSIFTLHCLSSLRSPAMTMLYAVCVYFWLTFLAAPRDLVCCFYNYLVKLVTMSTWVSKLQPWNYVDKNQMIDKGKGKGKAVPLQAWSGSEGSRKLRFPDFLATAQDGGKVVSLMHRPHLSPGNTPGTRFC
jgi:hypothetical protein